MHKSRSITRANAKKGKEAPMSIRNDAGYYDPTPYFAFKNMAREDWKQQRSKCPADRRLDNNTQTA